MDRASKDRVWTELVVSVFLLFPSSVISGIGWVLYYEGSQLMACGNHSPIATCFTALLDLTLGSLDMLIGHVHREWHWSFNIVWIQYSNETEQNMNG